MLKVEKFRSTDKVTLLRQQKGIYANTKASS
jgi:hypothetical protein